MTQVVVFGLKAAQTFTTHTEKKIWNVVESGEWLWRTMVGDPWLTLAQTQLTNWSNWTNLAKVWANWDYLRFVFIEIVFLGTVLLMWFLLISDIPQVLLWTLKASKYLHQRKQTLGEIVLHFHHVEPSRFDSGTVPEDHFHYKILSTLGYLDDSCW